MGPNLLNAHSAALLMNNSVNSHRTSSRSHILCFVCGDIDPGRAPTGWQTS